MTLFLLSIFASLGQYVVGGEAKTFPGSVISSASERVDVFFTDENNGQILHKYHANPAAGWNQGFEALNLSVPRKTYPSAAALGDQLHVFASPHGQLQHKFWDGTQWLPTKEWETLATGFDDRANLAVTARGTNRLHVVAKGEDGSYVHKHYDGSTWKPDGNEDVEALGKDGFGDEVFDSIPALSSWGPDRLDIVGILTNGTLLHKYWDGSQWQPSVTQWEQWGDDFLGTPVLTSWGESRLDVWASRASGDDKESLAHRWWDGHSLSDWEEHASYPITEFSVTHWASNRIDIVAHVAESNSFAYKYYDGYQWNPSLDEQKWQDHGPNSFSAYTAPVSVAWGPNNLNILAIDQSQSLKWQLWEGSQWLPAVNDFYDLGTPTSSSKQQQQHVKPSPKSALESAAKGKGKTQQDSALHVQSGENLDL